RCIGVAALWVGSGKNSVRRSPSTLLTRGRLQTFTPPSSTLPRSLNRLFTGRHLQRRACRSGAVSATADRHGDIFGAGNKGPEHFVDELSLAEIHASLERAADVLSMMKGSQARGRQRRRELKGTIFVSPRSCERDTDLSRAEAARSR